MADPINDDLFEGTFNKDKNEQDRVLRERGYDPSELSDDEKRSLLADFDSHDDPDNARLSDITPADDDNS